MKSTRTHRSAKDWRSAISICPGCRRPLPHDAPVCSACGTRTITVPDREPSETDGLQMLRRLHSLANGIGWTAADAGMLHVADALRLHLIVRRRKAAVMDVRVEDTTVGRPVLEAEFAGRLEDAFRLAADVAAHHVTNTYWPVDADPRPPLVPDIDRMMGLMDSLDRAKPRPQRLSARDVEHRIERHRSAIGAVASRPAIPRVNAIDLLEPGDITPIAGTDVPWSRIPLGQAVSIDLSGLPKAYHYNEVMRQRTLCNAWCAKHYRNADRRFLIRKRGQLIIILRIS